MDKSESRNEKPKESRRFSQEQYKFLKECSEKGEEGIKEWNEWRKVNPKEKILLEGAQFFQAYEEREDLSMVDPSGPIVHFNEGTYARIKGLYLEGVNLAGACLDRSMFIDANLKGSKFFGAWLKGADFSGANLEGVTFNGAKLQNARFSCATVDWATSFWNCKVNRYEGAWVGTDFSAVRLEFVCVDVSTKQLLEYNIRRMNWEEWYPKQCWSLRWLVRKFWKISDYGISAKQIIKTFFKLSFVFAIIYYIWGFIDYYLVGIKDYPGIVSDLFVLEDKQEVVSCWLVPFRAIYFYIVTMTTLGFGDMYANAHSFFRGLFGHALLALQVILGYVLLGALVTRFAVLFTADGPAGTFSKEKKK